jgi:hypothetical protein
VYEILWPGCDNQDKRFRSSDLVPFHDEWTRNDASLKESELEPCLSMIDSLMMRVALIVQNASDTDFPMTATEL